MIFDKYRIEICSDLNLDDLCADIYYNDHIIAVLTQEQGFDNIMIDLYPSKDGNNWNLKYSEFINAIEYAKQRLWDLRKQPKD